MQAILSKGPMWHVDIITQITRVGAEEHSGGVEDAGREAPGLDRLQFHGGYLSHFAAPIILCSFSPHTF